MMNVVIINVVSACPQTWDQCCGLSRSGWVSDSVDTCRLRALISEQISWLLSPDNTTLSLLCCCEDAAGTEVVLCNPAVTQEVCVLHRRSDEVGDFILTGLTWTLVCDFFSNHSVRPNPRVMLLSRTDDLWLQTPTLVLIIWGCTWKYQVLVEILNQKNWAPTILTVFYKRRRERTPEKWGGGG